MRSKFDCGYAVGSDVVSYTRNCGWQICSRLGNCWQICIRLCRCWRVCSRLIAVGRSVIGWVVFGRYEKATEYQ